MLAPPSHDLDRLDALIDELARWATRRTNHPLDRDPAEAKRIKTCLDGLLRVRESVGTGLLSRRHLRDSLALGDALVTEQLRAITEARARATPPADPEKVDEARMKDTAPGKTSAKQAMARRAREELDDE